MNLLLNLLVLIITGGFVGLFIYNLVLNVIRAINANKQMQQSYDSVEGVIKDIKKEKNRVYIQVEYLSKANNTKFADFFEMSVKEFKEQYTIGDKVTINYLITQGLKKVNCFPTFLSGQKIKVESTPIITDAILLLGGAYIFVTMLLMMLVRDESGLTGLMWNGRPLLSSLKLNTVPEGTKGVLDSNMFILLIAVFFYVVVFGYVLDRLTNLPQNQKTLYLKLCGVKGTAEVKTFKFSKSKNAQGLKESLMKISFFTNNGEKVDADLSSYLYSETQEQYVSILYDEKNPKNVVYMRK